MFQALSLVFRVSAVASKKEVFAAFRFQLFLGQCSRFALRTCFRLGFFLRLGEFFRSALGSRDFASQFVVARLFGDPFEIRQRRYNT